MSNAKVFNANFEGIRICRMGPCIAAADAIWAHGVKRACTHSAIRSLSSSSHALHGFLPFVLSIGRRLNGFPGLSLNYMTIHILSDLIG